MFSANKNIDVKTSGWCHEIGDSNIIVEYSKFYGITVVGRDVFVFGEMDYGLSAEK